jgi:hypothetical protein
VRIASHTHTHARTLKWGMHGHMVWDDEIVCVPGSL